MATVTTKNETHIQGDVLGQAINDVLAELNKQPTSVTPKPVVPNVAPVPLPVSRQTPRDERRVAYQPSPRAYMARLRRKHRTDWVDVLLRVWLICGVAFLGVVLAFAFPWSPFHSSADKIPIIRSFAGIRTKPIQDVRVGERLVGRNPIRGQVDGVEPDPATWRHISIHMTKESGLGLWIELLRPLTWIEEHDAKLGSTIFIDLYEMGAVGDAEVTYLGPCPKIHPGKGTVVTGTFKHQADENTNVVNLKLQDQIELTGVTDNHPYWSADRRDFVEVGKLRIGELVDTEYGLKRVISVTPIEHNGFLYNVETTEHVYRVGSLGTLVHNSCVIHGNPQFTSPAHAKAMQDMANRMAKSGAYTDVYMHSKWTTILQGKGTAVSPNRLPDIAGVRLDGRIDIIEFASSIGDKPSKVFSRNQAIWNQLPQHLRGDILVYDHLGNWIHAFP